MGLELLTGNEPDSVMHWGRRRRLLASFLLHFKCQGGGSWVLRYDTAKHCQYGGQMPSAGTAI